MTGVKFLTRDLPRDRIQELVSLSCFNRTPDAVWWKIENVMCHVEESIEYPVTDLVWEQIRENVK